MLRTRSSTMATMAALLCASVLVSTGCKRSAETRPPAVSAPSTVNAPSAASAPAVLPRAVAAAPPITLPHDGAIFTLLHQFEAHFRVAILAVIEGGRLREAARKDTCGLKKGRMIDVFSMHNEARLKLAVGGTDFHLTGHCHSSSNAKHLPRRNMVGTAGFTPSGRVKRLAQDAAARGRIEALARRDITRLLTSRKERRSFNQRFIHHGLEHSGLRYHVVEVKLKPRQKCTGERCWLVEHCGPGSHGNAGVLIYRARPGAAPGLVFSRLRTPTSAEAFEGEPGFVGLLPLRPVGPPWLILLNNACESWDFELLAPEGGSWKTRIKGAAGSTV
jgi:hypothetical protein